MLYNILQSINILLYTQDLAGKRSQDPYAFCYLLGKDGKTHFQVENSKSKTFNKNLSPDLKHEFRFRVLDENINEKNINQLNDLLDELG